MIPKIKIAIEPIEIENDRKNLILFDNRSSIESTTFYKNRQFFVTGEVHSYRHRFKRLGGGSFSVEWMFRKGSGKYLFYFILNKKPLNDKGFLFSNWWRRRESNKRLYFQPNDIAKGTSPTFLTNSIGIVSPWDLRSSTGTSSSNPLTSS